MDPDGPSLSPGKTSVSGVNRCTFCHNERIRMYVCATLCICGQVVGQLVSTEHLFSHCIQIIIDNISADPSSLSHTP